MSLIGGHCNMTNLDAGVLNYLVSTFGIESMIDVGCGPGMMIYLARKAGLQAYGVDGDPTVHPDVLHNFDHGPLVVELADLAWSVEFLEHVDECFLDNVFSVLEKCRYVFCTANPKPGPWHSNCQPIRYWKQVFHDRGFWFDTAATTFIRRVSTMERDFVRDTGMFFWNTKR